MLIFVTMLSITPCSYFLPYTTLFRSVRRHFDGLDGFRPIVRLVQTARARNPIAQHRVAVLQSLALMDAEQPRSEEHTSELQSHSDLVCRLMLEKIKYVTNT